MKKKKNKERKYNNMYIKRKEKKRKEKERKKPHVRVIYTPYTPLLNSKIGVYLRIKSLFFYLHDVTKTVGGVKIP